MLMLKQSLIACGCLTALIGLIALVTPATSQGQDSGNQPTRDVNVVNPASAPVLVRDVDVPLRTPVQIKVNTFISFGEQNGAEDVYIVPAGKRLVIEHVALESENLILASNAVAGRLLTSFGGKVFSHPFDIRSQAPVDGVLFVVNHPMLAFADPDTTVSVLATVDEPQGIGSGGYSALSGTLSGYLENVP